MNLSQCIVRLFSQWEVFGEIFDLRRPCFSSELRMHNELFPSAGNKCRRLQLLLSFICSFIHSFVLFVRFCFFFQPSVHRFVRSVLFLTLQVNTAVV